MDYYTHTHTQLLFFKRIFDLFLVFRILSDTSVLCYTNIYNIKKVSYIKKYCILLIVVKQEDKMVIKKYKYKKIIFILFENRFNVYVNAVKLKKLIKYICSVMEEINPLELI